MTIIARISVESGTKDCRLAVIEDGRTSYLYDTEPDPILKKERQVTLYGGHSCVLRMDNILSDNEHRKSDPTYEELQTTIEQINAQMVRLRKTLETSKRALQSYQFGNASTELAESIVANIDEVLVSGV